MATHKKTISEMRNLGPATEKDLNATRTKDKKCICKAGLMQSFSWLISVTPLLKGTLIITSFLLRERLHIT